MNFSLVHLSKEDLQALSESLLPSTLAARSEADALPPSFVAGRALELAEEGHPLPWSTTFLIVDNNTDRIVGSCGFKTPPTNGIVEVGYGVAPMAQGKSAATAALKHLVSMAFDAGATAVLAEVAPDNLASIRVVQKAGFLNIGSGFDQGNEYVGRWIRRCLT